MIQMRVYKYLEDVKYFEPKRSAWKGLAHWKDGISALLVVRKGSKSRGCGIV